MDKSYALKHIINLQMVRIYKAMKIIMHNGELSKIKLERVNLQTLDMLIDHFDIAKETFEHCDDFIKKEMPELYNIKDSILHLPAIKAYRDNAQEFLEKWGHIPTEKQSVDRMQIWGKEKSDSIKTIKDIQSALQELLEIENPEIMSMNFSAVWLAVNNIEDAEAKAFFNEEAKKMFPYIKVMSLNFTNRIIKHIKEGIGEEGEK